MSDQLYFLRTNKIFLTIEGKQKNQLVFNSLGGGSVPMHEGMFEYMEINVHRNQTLIDETGLNNSCIHTYSK